MPLMDTNGRHFNEVKKHLHDNDSAWIRQQFGLRRLSVQQPEPEVVGSG